MNLYFATFRHLARSTWTVVSWFVFVIFGLVGYLSASHAQEVPGGCGTLSRPWGPFDYRPERYVRESTYGSHAALLGIVENAHFTPEVEKLIRGKTASTPGGDLSYTLGVFPNHHRALLSVIALGEKEKKDLFQDARFTVECFLRRATTWRPDDPIVHMIFAQYLAGKSRTNEAEEQLKVAMNQAGDNAFTYHNIGLIYFDMKNYDKALTFAHKAYDLGLGIPTLRDQLKSVGKWAEPTGTPVADPEKKPE